MKDDRNFYLVDTSAWIWALRKKGIEEIKNRIDVLLGTDEVATTGLIKCEILSGAISEAECNELEIFLEALHFFETRENYWRKAGDLGFRLRRMGLKIGTYDLLIAVIALETRSIVVHADKHFDQIAGKLSELRIESYVKSVKSK